MKILFITSSFEKKGSASVRNIGLVNGLINLGHNIDVLTQKWPDNMIDKSMCEYIDKKVGIYRDNIGIIDRYFSKKSDSIQGSIQGKIGKYLRDLLKQIYFFPDIDKEWIKSYRKGMPFIEYDLYISSSDTKTSHFIAYELKKKYKKTWFAYWGDPWKDDMGTRLMKKSLAAIFERKFINAADANLYTSLPTLNSMKRRYKSDSNMFFLPRGYLEVVSSKANDEDKVIRFLYPGSIYYGRTISGLVDRIKEYNATSVDKRIKLDIYGYCDPGLTEEYKDEAIEFHGHTSFKEIGQIIEKSDVLVVLMNDKKSHQIPGKLYDFFGTNREIVAIMPGMNKDVYDFLINTDRCLVYEEDSIDVNEIIRRVNDSRWIPLRDYSIEAIARTVIDIYEKVCF